MNARRQGAALRPRHWALFALVLLGGACSRELTLGSDQTFEGGTAGVGGGSAGVGGAGGRAAGGSSGMGALSGAAGSAGDAPCEPVACRGKVYRCGNCDDDDGDGRIDADDLECTGPCDDLEDSLAVGLPGEGSAACQEDCYFDRGNGAGMSDCRFSARCDALSVAPDYAPSGEASCAYDENAKVPGSSATCSELREAQPQGCHDDCGPLTPNGCDCFGCCELPAGSGTHVFLETSLPCTPVPACQNDCAPCEACVGRPEPLPSCGNPDTEQCPMGYRPCGQPGNEACQVAAYCITGCCIPEPR